MIEMISKQDTVELVSLVNPFCASLDIPMGNRAVNKNM